MSFLMRAVLNIFIPTKIYLGFYGWFVIVVRQSVEIFGSDFYGVRCCAFCKTGLRQKFFGRERVRVQDVDVSKLVELSIF